MREYAVDDHVDLFLELLLVHVHWHLDACAEQLAAAARLEHQDDERADGVLRRRTRTAIRLPVDVDVRPPQRAIRDEHVALPGASLHQPDRRELAIDRRDDAAVEG